ncbi:MAG: ABC transporter ATP-binding protein [Bacillota bacterium]
MYIKDIIRAIKYVHSIGKPWFYSTIFFTIILGLIPVTTLWLTKELINEVARFINSDVGNYKNSLILLIMIFVLMNIDSIIRNIQSYMDSKLQIKLEHNLKYNISKKLSLVPYKLYDNTDFHHHLNRIQGNQGQRFLAPIDNTFIIIQSIITSVSLLWFLFNIHWSLGIISLLAGIPILIVKSFYGNKNFWLGLLQTPRAREANYIQRLLLERESSKEVKLFNLENYFIKRWSATFKQNAEESLSLLKKQRVSYIGLDSLSALFYSISAGIIIWLTKRATISIGEFVAIGQAVQETQNSINTISSSVAQIYENSLYIKDYFSFLNYEEDNLAGKDFPILDRGISINNLTFSYPGSDQNSLKNINLDIKAGEKIAIVGGNGSGKTTLVKCLLGLYYADQGDVSFENISIREINKLNLRKNMTVIFQDFLKYSFSVKENIQFGDVDKNDTYEDLEAVSKEAGIHSYIRSLPEKYGTYLGKHLKKGEDLSGGQWQRIALARALYKTDSQILIFDEPTSSLDPLSEIDMFNKIKNHSKNKTLIFISHRMAATISADKIIVMDSGEICEYGDHQTLLNRRGRYYEMYQEQANWFSNQKNEVIEYA